MPAKRHQRTTKVDEAVIRLRIPRLKEGYFLATSPDVPGLVVQARSITEAVEFSQDVARKIIESCLHHGEPLPPVFSKARHSPRQLLVPVGLS